MSTEKKITQADTNLIAQKCVEYLIDNGYITEFEDERQWDYHIQDVIQGEIDEVLGLDENNREVIIK